MRMDKLTIKAQEALQAAQSLADQHDHQSIEPEHLLQALVQQREGVVGPVLAKLGARVDAIQRQLESEITRLPKVRGGSGHYMGDRLRPALERAQTEAERLRDEYVSTEHLLIGIAQERDGAAGRVLAGHGVTRRPSRGCPQWLARSLDPAAARALTAHSCRDSRGSGARPLPRSRLSPEGHRRALWLARRNRLRHGAS